MEFIKFLFCGNQVKLNLAEMTENLSQNKIIKDYFMVELL